MINKSKPGMAVRRRTRSHVRRRAARNRRFFTQLVLAVLFATLASAGLFGKALDQEITAKTEPSSIPTLITEAAVNPPLPAPPTLEPSPTGAPFSNAIEQTAIALESATPAPTQPEFIDIPPTPLPTNFPESTPTPTPEIVGTPAPPVLYYTQPGDTLPILAVRFGVSMDEIQGPDARPVQPDPSLLKPGQLLIIPNRLNPDLLTSEKQLIPDSEVVFSPSAADFDIAAYVKQAGGFLSTYRQYLGTTEWTSGSDIIKRVALENSINPRILLALLEFKAHWVFGQPENLAETYYPLGVLDRERRDLYSQLNWAVDNLSIGYYSWRQGRLTMITFPDGTSIRTHPKLNAGTVAVQYLFALQENMREWGGDLYNKDGFAGTYEKMFGNPWIIAQSVEPLLPATLAQPQMELPFIPGQVWAFTGGPHGAWNHEGAWAALDFAPPSTESGCVKTNAWATAVATGLVVRSTHGVVVLDLDGDGREQTGWTILYLHIADAGRVPVGTWVEAGGIIGHPSCEGGIATGTHVHIARKYNGEWILADGPLPFNLSGWIAHEGKRIYEGTLTKDGKTVTACTCSSGETFISRPKQ